MATSGIVNASTCDKQDSNEKDDRPKKFYFGVFFDGTNNNMVQKNAAKSFREQSKNEDEWELEIVQDNGKTFANGANQIPKTKSGTPAEGYSNVAILHSFYQSMSQDEFDKCKSDVDVWIYNIYVEGVGADYDKSWFSNVKGKATGKGNAGVSHLVCKAVAMVRERLKAVKAVDRPETEVHFDVFGFSRGAACARLFSYLALRTSKKQKLKCEGEFENTLAKGYYKKDFLHFLDFLGTKYKLKQVTVDFLGLFDTVSSIGGLSTDSYANNVRDYGLHSPTLDKVLNTFHLCAMDEFREHFALTDIGSACHKGGNAEIFIPGCHTDVGGGYKTGKYSFTLISDNNRVFPKDRIEGPTSFLPVNEDSLKMLGWGNDKEIWTTYDSNLNVSFISVKRRIESGYSNIPLIMMKVRTEDKVQREAFNSFDGRYEISEKFSSWKDSFMSLCEKTGRQWYYPGGSFSSKSYQQLRAFLHFSSKETVVGAMLGNRPNYNDQLMCRPITNTHRNFQTRNCELEELCHPETGVPFVRKDVTTSSGEVVTGVFPVFESAFDAELPNDLFEATDDKQFAECNKQLKEQYEKDQELRKLFSEEQLICIQIGKTPKGYTWHHNEEIGKMQLVGSKVHSLAGHTGGKTIWGGGTEKR